MKLKEFPESFFRSLTLSLKSSNTLKSKNGNEIPVIVSLTSIPSRLKTLHLTIKSVLTQNSRPEKIVLWLHEDLKLHIPKALKKLEGDIFSIQYSKYTFSHRKLIHSLKLFTETTIITCDDDIMYPKNWLENLYKEHLQQPNAIIANRTRCINYNSEGELMPYKQWNCNTNSQDNLRLAIGLGGVVYPPNSLNSLVTNVDLFMELAPKADDLWFKCMALLNQTEVIQVKNPTKVPTPIAGTQKISLKNDNVKKDLNREQWLKLDKHFKLYDTYLK